MTDEDRKDASQELEDFINSLDPRRFNQTLLNDEWLNKQSKSALIGVVKSLATRLDMLSTAQMKRSDMPQIIDEPAAIRSEPKYVTEEIIVPAAFRDKSDEAVFKWELLLLPKEKGHRPLQIKVAGDFTIGRQRGEKAVDLDLTAFDAAAMGVSGQHAAVRVTPDNLYLVDLNSTNGTYYQREKLDMGNPVLMTEGAVISFGKVVFLVSRIQKLG